jgi:hypothetical protein
VAGLRIVEMRPMLLGAICDLYVYRLRYDDMEHGIVRKREHIYD